jgi:hypothetical protein
LSRVFTTSTFARRLGFKNASEKRFRQLIKLAVKKGLLRIEQGGFKGDSMHHPKLVVLMKSFDEVKFIERAAFPSYTLSTEVGGYRLVKHRTGRKRLLKSGKYSQNEWWVCEDCGRKIRIGQPYASKIDFSKAVAPNMMPVSCKCVSCYLDLVEYIHGLE